MWYCKRCQKPQAAKTVDGKPHVVRFPSGYVAVYLQCGHTAAVARDKVKV